jgi:ATP-dependent protease HslVU (ClpYQ) peptidase subunit
MNAIKRVRNFVLANPRSKAAAIFTQLAVELERAGPFRISDLYELDYDQFELALELIKDWRLDRYYTSKLILLDIALSPERP